MVMVRNVLGEDSGTGARVVGGGADHGIDEKVMLKMGLRLFRWKAVLMMRSVHFALSSKAMETFG